MGAPTRADGTGAARGRAGQGDGHADADADDLIALGDQPRTRADLALAAANVARALRVTGVRTLVLATGDRYHIAAVLLGAWAADAVVLLPPSLRPEAVRGLAARTDADLVLSDDGGSTAGETVAVADVLAGGGAAATALAPPAPALAALPRDGRHLVTVFTSGSTGEPAAWPKTSGQLLGEADLVARLFGMGAGARVLCTAPPHHLYGLLFGVLAPLVGGGAFVRTASPLPADIAAQARRFRASVLAAVPSHYAGFSALDAGDLPEIERAFCSGGRLDAPTRDDLGRRFPFRLVEIFGSSETGGIAYRDARTPDALSPWRPLPGVRAGADDDGRLLVDSPFLPPHGPRPFPCADRVRVDPDGTFQHLGRADDVVKIGGERVSIAEVEARIRAVAGVRDAAVAAVFTDGPRQWELWAAVVAPGHGAESLRTALTPVLDPVAIPRRFALLVTLPRQDSGKLPRQALLDCFPPADAQKN
jgi:acyl-coenzyme A synthetase/AMP-(fatty) acid ligase